MNRPGEPSRSDRIRNQVHHLYWDEEINCARITLRVLAELHQVTLHPQVLHAGLGMHGAGQYGAQCGLLEGGLMFLGILGKQFGFDDNDIAEFCQELAQRFETRFGSLACRDLRPQGFAPDNPPHLCEKLTGEALIFLDEFIDTQF